MRRRKLSEMTLRERLDRRSSLKESGCIEFDVVSRKGYGSLWFHGRSYRAHRVAWELENGPIPDGLVIDHLCRNRACVNADHLEVVSPGENTLRGESFAGKYSRQTHCLRGHKLPTERAHNGTRRCKECRTKKYAQSRRERYDLMENKPGTKRAR